MNKVYGILLVVILCFSIFICKVSAFQYTPAPEGETVYYCGNNANKNLLI